MIDIATALFTFYLSVLLVPVVLIVAFTIRAFCRSVLSWHRNRLAGDWYRRPVRYSLQQLSDHDSTDRYWIGR